MKVYEIDEIFDKLKNLEGWEYINNEIQKTFKFSDFKTAIAAVNIVAEEAETLNHHPDILIYSWNRVQFKLSTHSEKGITDNDFNLAGRINNSLK